MNIETAVALVLGDELANSIILDMGLHWAVVAAVTEASSKHDQRAVAEIKRWVAAEKEKSKLRAAS